MAISNSAATFPCSIKLSARSGFSTPTRFFSPWPCSLTRKGGESSSTRFLRPDAAFSYPNLRLQPLSALGRFGSSGGGAGVLERPKFDQSQFDRVAQAQEGGDIGKLINQKAAGHGDSYKVLLVDDSRHTEKLVMEVLPQAVPSVTPERARQLFYDSQQNGIAIVIYAVKEHAEFYVQMMIEKGLCAEIEPASTKG